jgi:radical SAM superfamily enzyme YgiQ (UPF0313 family)
MKIVFVNIKLHKLDTHFFNPSIAALAASLRRAGFASQVINVNYKKDLNKFADEIARVQPDLMLFSVMSINWELVKELARIAKEEVGSYNICGGYHPTLCPEEVIGFEHVDAICLGEGDHALVDVVIDRNMCTGSKKIKNFWFKEKNRVFKNAIRPLEENLDSLPYWDREIFLPYDIPTQTGTPVIAKLRHDFFPDGAIIVNTYSGRGCYYKCSYCTNNVMLNFNKGLGHYVRHRSPGNIVQELEVLCDKYKPDYIEFTEEHFPISTNWLSEFAREYASVGRPFGINYRFENSKVSNMRLLAGAGCKLIYYGLECGNEEYRRKFLNRSVSNDQVIRAAGLARKMGIEFITYNMIGLPYETANDIRATIDLNRQIKPAFPCFFTFQPFPMTELYELCKKDGLLLEENSISFCESTSILRTEISEVELAILWQEIRKLQEECLASRERSFFNEIGIQHV